MATYNPLKIQQQKLAAQQAELERQIAEELAKARAEGIRTIRNLMSTYSIKPSELESKSRKPKGRNGKKVGKARPANKN